MNEPFHCPYCEQEKDSGAAIEFCSCRFCGYKSALVRTADDVLLIVDRRMPFLRQRCREISHNLPGVKIIVDRRITQDPFEEEERRLIPQRQTV